MRNLLEMGETDLLGCDTRIGEPGFSCAPIQGVNNLGMLWAWKPEAVLICTPPETHYKLARETLRNMAHCFIEKPIAMNAYEAERICTVAENNKLHVAIGYQLLACPSVQAFPREWKSLSIWDRQDIAKWPKASYARDLLLDFSHEISMALLWAGSLPSRANVVWDGPVQCIAHLAWTDGRTAKIELVGDYDGYERGAISDCGSWKFDREENDEAYRTELKMFLAGRPICTADHGLSVMQILGKAGNHA